MKESKYFKYNSKWGEMVAEVNEEGALKGLWFVGQKHFPNFIPSELENIEEFLFKRISSHDQKIENSNSETNLTVSLNLLLSQLKAYECGELEHFTIAVDPDGTSFQKEVWHILTHIPFGETSTYGDISQKVARRRNLHSMSAQAVGQAVGHNPISIIIPCHRVIGKDGSLTGYAGGIERKIALLELEKANRV